MKFRETILQIINHENINFLLTNRLPRRWLTLFIGWFSKIEQPLVRDMSIAVWRFFSGLDLQEAKKTGFSSMHDCFIRELKADARPVDPSIDILTSPCDAIIGACGTIANNRLFQAKGFPYQIEELIGNYAGDEWHAGQFVTLRLTSAMYHRFHAPCDCNVEQVCYFSGDTWNVNPIALQRIEKLFCRNERAFIRMRLISEAGFDGQCLALVPVAAILVASIRLHFVDTLLHLKYHGPGEIPCNASLSKGEEMGWFQHGSTIIVLAPRGFELHPGLQAGSRILTGQPLLQWTADEYQENLARSGC